MTDEIARLVELSEKAKADFAAAKDKSYDSFERAASFASEMHFRKELAFWFRAYQGRTQGVERMSNDDIVGHKTFRDGKGGFTHEPLTRSEADTLHASLEESYRIRREKYPDEQTCVNAIFDACLSLEEMGWKRAYLAPPDGKIKKTVSLGSTGIHDAYCEQRSQHPITLENWWWHPDEGDLWPHEPIYYKP